EQFGTRLRIKIESVVNESNSKPNLLINPNLFFAVSFLESVTPLSCKIFSAVFLASKSSPQILAHAATTGPASGPRPTSSTPAKNDFSKKFKSSIGLKTKKPHRSEAKIFY